MHLRLNLRKEFHVSHGPNYLKKIKFKIHFPTTQKNRVYTYKMKKKKMAQCENIIFLSIINLFIL